jgi:hypothetical protein
MQEVLIEPAGDRAGDALPWTLWAAEKLHCLLYEFV